MRVISDTSVLSNLAIIGRLELLHEQFGEVRMPTAVNAELNALLLNRAINDGWLMAEPLDVNAPFPDELRGLDAGETEALRLALSMSADRVLMDERDGRQRAAAIGLRTIGVLGVLLAARKAGVISSLKDEIIALRRDAGFFIAKPLEAQLLEAAGE